MTPDRPVDSDPAACVRCGSTNPKVLNRCPAASDPHKCFELDGARVHGDPQMSDESREALREVIAAARSLLDNEGGTSA